jgi:hypothetical protein
MDYLPISYGKSEILVPYRVIPLYYKQLIEKELCKRRAFSYFNTILRAIFLSLFFYVLFLLFRNEDFRSTVITLTT